MRDSLARDAVSAWMLRAALCAAVLSASCFDPRYPADRPCGADGWCPPGQGCIDMVCRLPGYVPPGIDARIDTPDAEVPIMVEPNDASLELLAPSAGALSPAFDREVTAYTLQVSSLVQAVLWEARAAHPSATVRIDGMDVTRGRLSAPIAVGASGATVEIEVTAPAGNSRVYTVMVRGGGPIAQAFYVKPSSPRVGDTAGWSVALSGDTLAVGAPLEDTGAEDSGAVFVFRRTGGTWVEQAILKSDAPSQLHEFGLHVALDGDTLAVGEPGNASVTSSPGSVHVFRRKEDGTWVHEVRLEAEIPRDDSELGIRLALDGDTLVTGAHLESEGGSAYVFRHDGTAWAQEARLQASNAGPGDGFGYSVAIDGDLIVVGARHEDSADTGVGGDGSDDTATDSGAAYVFRRSGATWSQEAYLKASDTGAGDRFGYRVATSGGLVVVSAPCQDEEAVGAAGGDPVCKDSSPGDSLIRNSGAVYVFGHDGQSWSERAILKAPAPNREAHAHFGHGLDVRDGLVAVGAPDEDGGLSGSGAIYLIDCAVTCATPQRRNAARPGDSDGFGFFVDLSVDGLAAGAPYEDSAAMGVNGNQDDNSVAESGAAYLFQ